MPSSGRIATADDRADRRRRDVLEQRGAEQEQQQGAGGGTSDGQLRARAGLVHRGGARGGRADREAAAGPGGDVADAEGEQVAVRVGRVAALLAVARETSSPSAVVTRVSAIADGTSASHVAQSITGQVSVGGPARPRRAPRRPRRRGRRPRRRWSRPPARPAPTGTAAATRLPTSSTTTETTEISTDQPLIVSSPVTSSSTLSTNSPPRVDLDPEHLRDLADQDVQGEPADEADEDRLARGSSPGTRA